MGFGLMLLFLSRYDRRPCTNGGIDLWLDPRRRFDFGFRKRGRGEKRGFPRPLERRFTSGEQEVRNRKTFLFLDQRGGSLRGLGQKFGTKQGSI